MERRRKKNMLFVCRPISCPTGCLRPHCASLPADAPHQCTLRLTEFPFNALWPLRTYRGLYFFPLSPTAIQIPQDPLMRRLSYLFLMDLWLTLRLILLTDVFLPRCLVFCICPFVSVHSQKLSVLSLTIGVVIIHRQYTHYSTYKNLMFIGANQLKPLHWECFGSTVIPTEIELWQGFLAKGTTVH